MSLVLGDFCRGIEFFKRKFACLLGFQSKFDEDLLELFVDVVNAELFEAVLVEYLEAVDVQDSDVDLLNVLSHCSVHRLQHNHTASTLA